MSAHFAGMIGSIEQAFGREVTLRKVVIGCIDTLNGTRARTVTVRTLLARRNWNITGRLEGDRSMTGAQWCIRRNQPLPLSGGVETVVDIAPGDTIIDGLEWYKVSNVRVETEGHDLRVDAVSIKSGSKQERQGS